MQHSQYYCGPWDRYTEGLICTRRAPAPISKQFFAEAAARYDYYNTSGGKASPKVGLKYVPPPQLGEYFDVVAKRHRDTALKLLV